MLAFIILLIGYWLGSSKIMISKQSHTGTYMFYESDKVKINDDTFLSLSQEENRYVISDPNHLLIANIEVSSGNIMMINESILLFKSGALTDSLLIKTEENVILISDKDDTVKYNIIYKMSTQYTHC